MPSATASASEGALTDDQASGRDLAALLDAVTTPELDLPCQAGDVDLWFAEAPTELERAKHLCGDCPIRASCLAGAQARREPWGVWGGEIFEQGVVVAAKRPRGRPRKNSTGTAEPVRQPSAA